MVLICDGKYMKKSHLLQAVALDRAVYPQSYWLDDETALGYLYARPEVYTYAVDGDELVAYLNMSCIDERSYLTLLEGYQNDLCIDAGNLTEPMPNCNNYLYFSSIAVAPAYRGIGIARKLFARFGEKLSLLRKRGVYFTDVIADAVSPHGEKACLTLGMKFDKVTQCGGKLFRHPMETGEPNPALDSFIKNLLGDEYGKLV